MEPTSTPAARGSLADPEIRTDVPGHVIPIITREFDDFDTESAKFLRGETEEVKFIGFRLKQGVYGQRQAERQMIRVKLPFGGINPEQMDAFADAVERWVPLRKGHITTRQNFQFHHVPLPDAAEFIREISAVGLSSREGCGNTMRNVTGDPWAGVSEGELFDPTPYVGAYVRYFVRNEVCQLMPRKFKTAFSATDEDVAITAIHDGGFIPRIRDGERGFEIRIGGGTSIMPRLAPVLYDFVAADNGDYLKVTEAVLRIFDRQDWLRKNRARARIKVLIDKIGIDAFREQVEEELRGDWVAERDFAIEPLLFRHDERPGPAPAGPAAIAQRRLARVRPLRRRQRPPPAPGRVRHRRGQGHPRRPHPRAVPRAWRRSCASTPAATPGPPSSRTSSCAGCTRRRSTTSGARSPRSTSAAPGPREITDVVSCPGTDSCKLGIASSMGLNQAVQERVEAMDIDDELTRRIHIKMSGCPNGCSQHHIANIGFYGASIKVGEHAIPAYIPHLAGSFAGGEVAIGKRLKARLPAKRVPEAVERWIRYYQAEREDGEEFGAFVERVGVPAVRGAGQGADPPGRVQPDDDERLHRLEPLRALPGHPGRGRVRRMSTRAAAPDLEDRTRRGGARLRGRALPSPSS